MSDGRPILKRANGALATLADIGAFGSRLSVAWSRLQASRLTPGKSRCPDLRGVDAAWLTAAMGAGPAITDVQTLDHTAGTTERARLGLQYADGSNGPASVFVKTAPTATLPRLFGNVLSLGTNEVGFYKSIAPDLQVRVPTCHAHACDSNTGAFVLVLEDLGASATEFATVESALSAQQIESVLEELAALHAAHWRSPRFATDLSWLQQGAQHRNSRVARAISSSAHRPTLRKYGAIVSPKVRAHASSIHANRRALDALWASGAQTVIHGDSHVGNMFFQGDRAGLLDWQVVQRGQGMRDVAYFLITSVDTQRRRAHEQLWIRHYLRGLRELGVPPIDTAFESAWAQYRAHALYAWVAASVTASLSDLQPPEIRRLALMRADAALLDLDAFSLLETLTQAQG